MNRLVEFVKIIEDANEDDNELVAGFMERGGAKA
jgi:hypothetical protein